MARSIPRSSSRSGTMSGHQEHETVDLPVRLDRRGNRDTWTEPDPEVHKYPSRTELKHTVSDVSVV
jgi:hypothetical protein